MPTCKHRVPEIDCKWCTTSVAWAIVKDAKGMRETGHIVAVNWARATLGLENRDEVRGSRRTYGEGTGD